MLIGFRDRCIVIKLLYITVVEDSSSSPDLADEILDKKVEEKATLSEKICQQVCMRQNSPITCKLNNYLCSYKLIDVNCIGCGHTSWMYKAQECTSNALRQSTSV